MGLYGQKSPSMQFFFFFFFFFFKKNRVVPLNPEVGFSTIGLTHWASGLGLPLLISRFMFGLYTNFGHRGT